MAMMLDRKAQINMTPMIDILLVLIIIFMVITPLTTTGLRTLVPQPPPTSQIDPPAQDIVITIRPDGTVRLNQEPVNVADLRQRLIRLVRTATDHVIFVRGEKGLEFRAVAEVIDIANGAGFNRVALMTE